MALVTGAARGIGAAVATALAREGWTLMLVDVCGPVGGVDYPLPTMSDLIAVGEGCLQGRAPGVEVAYEQADVRDQAALDRAVAGAVGVFGGLDAAVACAGVIAGGDPLWETTDERFEVLMDVNLAGVWRLARAAVPALLERPRPRRGRFVAIASGGGLVGLPRLAAYSAAKHGVIGLVRSPAAELGPEEITANAVCPGSTRTAMLEASAAVYGLGSAEEFAVHHMLPRLLEPEEVAAAVVWLCSEAASGVTGTAFPVDAGMTAR